MLVKPVRPEQLLSSLRRAQLPPDHVRPILVVDDNAVKLKLMRILLAGEGYAVRTAVDAEAGCDGYITKPIDTRTLTATIAGYLEKERG